MAQRAALARALARGPGVLLLDEPFGALDALTRLRMQDLLLDVHSAEPATIVLVTHDVDEALYLADRVVLLGADPADPGAGSGIARTVTVPGARPRDRADAELARIRSELLAGLGVPSHHGAGSAASLAS
jgi:sulfonate transport system ATP-binding protein